MIYWGGWYGHLSSKVTKLEAKVSKMIGQINREIPGQARNEEE